MEKKLEATTKQDILAKRSSRKQVPALFKKIDWEPESFNLDIGGGAYEVATEWLAERGVTNLVIDKFNRSLYHNHLMRLKTYNLELSSITLANVLNVIQGQMHRIKLLEEVFEYYSEHRCPVYISCYNATGQPSASECQTCMSLTEYIPEIESVFTDSTVTIQNNFIKIV